METDDMQDHTTLLTERLAYEPKVEPFEISKPAVNEFARPARCADRRLL